MANPRPSAGPAAGIARAGARRQTLSVVLSPGMLRWLKTEARQLGYELGTNLITPAFIAHRVIKEAQDQEWKARYGGAK